MHYGGLELIRWWVWGEWKRGKQWHQVSDKQRMRVEYRKERDCREFWKAINDVMKSNTCILVFSEKFSPSNEKNLRSDRPSSDHCFDSISVHFQSLASLFHISHHREISYVLSSTSLLTPSRTVSLFRLVFSRLTPIPSRTGRRAFLEGITYQWQWDHQNYFGWSPNSPVVRMGTPACITSWMLLYPPWEMSPSDLECSEILQFLWGVGECETYEEDPFVGAIWQRKH